MLRTLIVEDDFTSRKILQALLAPFGLCDIAVNGAEALQAFRAALKAGEPYHLVCLDITMPGMDGHRVLAEVRDLEARQGIEGLERTKVIMTTASSDPKDVRSAFHSECDAYMVKPIQRAKLMDHLRELELLDAMFS